jgi:cell division protein FtsW
MTRRQEAGTPRRLELDHQLVGAALALLLIGIVMVTSASITTADRSLGTPFYYLYRQLAFAGLGMVVATLLIAMPTRWWEALGVVALGCALLLLLAVLIPGVGKTVNGSTRWIPLGPISLQVSEPARLLFLIYVASYLVRHQQAVQVSLSAFLRPLGIVAIACLLLLAEPDFGAATVLLATVIGVMLLGGSRWRDFAMISVVTAALLTALAVASPYRLERITGFLDPFADPFDSGFQLTQSLIAIGRGEIFGVGIGNSVQKMFYLPEAHTDFVFAVLAEETGLVGVLIVIALYGLLVWRSLSIGRAAAAAGLGFQAYLAFGIGLWLGLQASVNMGVNMGLLPTKGLALPLLSYGGSSLLVSFAAIALLLRIHHETQRSGVPQAPVLKEVRKEVRKGTRGDARGRSRR